MQDYEFIRRQRSQHWVRRVPSEQLQMVIATEGGLYTTFLSLAVMLWFIIVCALPPPPPPPPRRAPWHACMRMPVCTRMHARTYAAKVITRTGVHVYMRAGQRVCSVWLLHVPFLLDLMPQLAIAMPWLCRYVVVMYFVTTLCLQQCFFCAIRC